MRLNATTPAATAKLSAMIEAVSLFAVFGSDAALTVGVTELLGDGLGDGDVVVVAPQLAPTVV
jgi:hypothetical protein